ncbi:MAG: hypothetical protein ACPKQO_08520 [Nitrososphaeraceae archaeon]
MDSNKPIEFFAIQNTQSSSINEINSTSYSLELNDISDNTILFTDRHGIIVTSISKSDLMENWTIKEDSFVKDIQNAVLIADEKEGKQYVEIIELFNSVYDMHKKTLKYGILPDKTTSIFTSSVLIIYIDS